LVLRRARLPALVQQAWRRTIGWIRFHAEAAQGLERPTGRRIQTAMGGGGVDDGRGLAGKGGYGRTHAEIL
jgi:hypothetical protein